MEAKTRKIFFIAYSICFISLSIASTCYPYNIEGTGGHEQITDWTFKLLRIENPEITNIIYGKDIKNGAVAEDKGLNPLSHFYNPSTGWGLMSWADNAKFKAESYYSAAVKQKSYTFLGHALHLLQDMASPSHANSASHMSQFKRQKGYEYWVTNNWDNSVEPYLVKYFIDNPQFQYLIQAGNINGYIDTMAEYTFYGGYTYDYDGKGPKSFFEDPYTSAKEG